MAIEQFEQIPGRVFLDTCVVNLLIDHSETIHDNCAPSTLLTERVASDVEALRNLWIVGQRAQWQLAISPLTYHEVTETTRPDQRRKLQAWFFELWAYWQEALATETILPQSPSSLSNLHLLPDANDRRLVIDSVMYNCDAFCTRDWSTILRHRTALSDLGVRIITPTEWWRAIKRWAGIWA